jgi:hypothetical protein
MLTLPAPASQRTFLSAKRIDLDQQYGYDKGKSDNLTYLAEAV